MAQQQLNILEAVKILLESGTVTINHVSDQGNQFDLHLKFSGLDSDHIFDLRSLCDQFDSVKIKDDHGELDVETIQVDTSGFIDPWNVKTGTEPWWPFIEKASTDPSMLNKHSTLSDVELLKIYYSSSSARDRAKHTSNAFTTKGNSKGRGQYDYLREFVQKHPALSLSKDGNFQANKRHRVHCTWNMINGVPVYTGFVKVVQDPERIVVCFTRASSFPPTYGGNGMFIRGKEAAKAWADLRLSFYTTVDDQVVLNPDTNLSELQDILDAAQQSQVVDLLSVGFDAFTTNLPSLEALSERYGHLQINLVFAVPDHFPRQDLFPRMSIGVRYGQIRLSELDAHRKGNMNSDMAACVEEFCQAVNLRKEHVAFSTNLQELTRGRANFRISPDTKTDSGVPAAQENKEKGWTQPGLPRANRRKHRKQPDLKRRRVSEVDGEDDDDDHDQKTEYFDINRRADERVRKELGSSVVKAHNIHQQIVFSCQKRCWPWSKEDPACYAVPESSLPRDIYGPQTDTDIGDEKNPYIKYRQRFLNSGVAMGTVGAMRKLFTEALTRAEQDPNFGSDQKIFTQLFGPDERLGRYKKEHLDAVRGKDVEFGLGMDYESSIGLATVFAEDDTEWLTASNQEQLEQANSRPLPREQSWSDVSLFTNVWTGITPAVIHHNAHRDGMKSLREEWWNRTWYQEHARTLYNSHIIAPLGPLAISGGKQWWSPEDWKGGAGVDPQGVTNETWVRYEEMCDGTEDEVFRDGLGPWRLPDDH
ncbi:hypothetical protein KCU65_g7787, partial [Aureobasidium melanogenum]